jgi:hypothetical protein
MGKSAAKLVLGGVITVLSFANRSFGLFRGFEYLQKNAPAFFAIVSSPAFETTLIVTGLSLTALGLYEIWKGIKPGENPALAGARSTVSVRDQSLITSIGSIGNIGHGATVIVGNDGLSKVAAGARPAPVRPNINYCGFRRVNVFVSPWPFIGVREPTDDEEFDHAMRGVVIKFENDLWLDGNGSRAINVLAKVVYRFATEPDVRLDYAVWLGAGIRFETLDIGDTRELLLILHSKTEDRSPELSVLNDNRDINDHFPSKFTWFRFENIAQPESIQVTLIERQSRAKYVFELGVNGSDADLGVILKNSSDT